MAKLVGKPLAAMAAILGISNAGKDDTFIGPYATVTPANAAAFCKGRQGSDLLESAVYTFGAGFFESEEMADMFVDEARGWVKTLGDMDIDAIKNTWPRYASFVNAITE